MEVVINEKKLKNEWGSFRLINTLTPNTFTKKIIILSTMFQCETGLAETAVSQQRSLNHKTIEYSLLEWKTLKKHQTIEDAIKFHFDTWNNFCLEDAEVSYEA